MQKPEQLDIMVGQECNPDESYGWLVIFKDGNRMDLHVQSIDFARETIVEDKLCKVLLDKDGILPVMEEATEQQYYVKKPTKEEFLFQCNEFWWCLNNVAKGLWREEVPYAMDMLNLNVRPCLITLLSWKAGIVTDFSCSVGKSAKYLYRYLEKEEYETFLMTYPDANIEHIWRAVFTMCDLFGQVAREIAAKLDYYYEEKDERGARLYLETVYRLPKNAKEILFFQ